MIIRVSFLVVASSFAALSISQTKTSSPTKRNGTMKSTGCDASHLEHEFEVMENSTANAIHVMIQNEEKHINFVMPQNLVTVDLEEFELLIGGEKMGDAAETELLQNLVQNYKQREVTLERKLLELNGLKEEQSAIAQLQRQLENKTEKLDSLKVTIASLQSENKIIREKIREDALSKKQLDIAKKMINEMQRKKDDVNGSTVKEQILLLQQQVLELQKYNRSARDAMVNKKLKDVQGIELEILELKRRHKELELEKREIGAKLDTPQAKAKTEEDTVAKIKEEITGLRHVQGELSEQVERLQRNRLEMIQELVYQRWLHTCLRFEVHNNHQKRNREAPRRSWGQNSSKEEPYGKAHALAYDPELDSSSSNATTSDESDGTETTTLESSSSCQSSSSKNSSLLSKMKRWRKTKHDSEENISSKGRTRTLTSQSSPGLIHRFSMPMVLPSDLSMPLSLKISSTKSLEKPMMPRLKRVSFGDCSVKLSTYQDMSEAVEEVIHDKETRREHQEGSGAAASELYFHKANQSSNSEKDNCCKGLIIATMSEDGDMLKTKNETRPEHEAEQYDEPSNSNESAVGNLIKDDTIAENEGTKSEIGGSDEMHSRHELVCGKDDRIKAQLVQLVALFFFSLILLAYFRGSNNIA